MKVKDTTTIKELREMSAKILKQSESKIIILANNLNGYAEIILDRLGESLRDYEIVFTRCLDNPSGFQEYTGSPLDDIASFLIKGCDVHLSEKDNTYIKEKGELK